MPFSLATPKVRWPISSFVHFVLLEALFQYIAQTGFEPPDLLNAGIMPGFTKIYINTRTFLKTKHLLPFTFHLNDHQQ